MEIYLQKQLNGSLLPVYDSDHDKVKKMKVHRDYKCVVTAPRNIKFHRKFFALINMLFDNQEIYKEADRLRKDLLISAGYFNEWIDFYGEEHREAKSISFASMGEIEFGELYSKVLDEIVRHFHFDKQDIIDNVEQYF